jgi:CheY-like chemotaxis protein
VDTLQFKTVLILDDDKDEAEPLARSFVNSGLAAISVTDAPSDAVLRLYLEAADLVVMDWMLKGWRNAKEQAADDDGSAVAFRLLRDTISPCGLPVVIHTGANRAAVIQKLENEDWYKSKEHPVLKKENAAEAVKTIREKARTEAGRFLSGLFSTQIKPRMRQAVQTVVQDISKWNRDVLVLFHQSFETDEMDFGTAAQLMLHQMVEQKMPPTDDLNTLFADIIKEREKEIAEESKVDGKEPKKGDRLKFSEGSIKDYLVADATLRYLPIAGDEAPSLDTGDIVLVNQTQQIYGLVITPRCDVIRSKSVKLLMGMEAIAAHPWQKTADTLDEYLPQYLVTKTPSTKYALLADVPVKDERKHILFYYNWVETARIPRNKEQAQSEFGDWEANPTRPGEPKLFDFPRIEYIKLSDRVARLRSPYVENLIADYTRFQLRVGVPSRPIKAINGVAQGLVNSAQGKDKK